MGAAHDLQLADLVIDGLVNAQVTTIITDSDLFEPIRALVERHAPAPWGELLRCYLCTGTWVGLVQAGLHGGRPGAILRRAFATACAGRLVRAVTDHSL